MQRDRKMKRFIKVYLTMFVIALLTTNLVLVLIYGQQFLYSAATDGSSEEQVLNSIVFIINGVVLVVFAIFWAIASHYYKQSKETLPTSNNKEW